MNSHEICLTKGFWKDMYDRNAQVSIYAVQKRFEESGRFQAMRFTHAEKPEVPLHFFYDSDVAKWIEAVGGLLKVDRKKYADLETFCDSLIDDIEKHQRADGYFNSYFQQKEPEKVFTCRDKHELYCMGHLIEAAIAYDDATNKPKFLSLAKKMVDCIEKVFLLDKSAPYETSGHEEIEIALLRLYDYTGAKKYLELAEHFINARGTNKKDIAEGQNFPIANEYYYQDNAPAREMQEADGHAVRACYYYTAMAALAERTKDEGLKKACQRLYENIVTKKMYVTGGVGSTKIGESFATAYSLPNSTAYSESCAAIALMFFCYNMLSLEHDAKYSDTIERVMYNGLLSSTSLDGKAFFYENPLEINVEERNIETSIRWKHRQAFPITQRMEVFGCSCCPPNINRVMATIAKYAYFEEKEGLFIEQFMSSKIEKYGVEVDTMYPLNDSIRVTGKGYPFSKIAVRIPTWCEEYTFSRDAKIQNGYAVFEVEKDFELVIGYPQKARFLYANTKIFSDIGKVALTYGPLVYCLEGKENGNRLTDLFVNTDSTVAKKDADFHTLFNLTCEGVRVRSSESLYSTQKPKKEKVTLTYIPYFTFANRGEQNMQVWVNELK